MGWHGMTGDGWIDAEEFTALMEGAEQLPRQHHLTKEQERKGATFRQRQTTGKRPCQADQGGAADGDGVPPVKGGGGALSSPSPSLSVDGFLTAVWRRKFGRLRRKFKVAAYADCGSDWGSLFKHYDRQAQQAIMASDQVRVESGSHWQIYSGLGVTIAIQLAARTNSPTEGAVQLH
jgi:hypothetical protein